MELEARLKLSDDDVFYLRHNNNTLTLEVERLRDENAAMRATSRGKEKAKVEKLERENAELQKTIATMRERLNWLELEQWYVVDKKETKL